MITLCQHDCYLFELHHELHYKCCPVSMDFTKPNHGDTLSDKLTIIRTKNNQEICYEKIVLLALFGGTKTQKPQNVWKKVVSNPTYPRPVKMIFFCFGWFLQCYLVKLKILVTYIPALNLQLDQGFSSMVPPQVAWGSEQIPPFG